MGGDDAKHPGGGERTGPCVEAFGPADRIGRTTGGLEVALRSLTDDEPATLGAALEAIDPWRRYPVDADGLARFLAAVVPGVRSFAVTAGGDLAGAIVVQPNWLRGPYLQLLAVLPEFQGQGIGRAVLEWLEREGRAASARHVWIMVSEFNSPARAFYARQDYREIAPVPAVVADDITEILVCKRIEESRPCADR